MKFQITEASGNQYVIETEKSHSQLIVEYPLTTDIQPVREAVPVTTAEDVKPPKKIKSSAK